MDKMKGRASLFSAGERSSEASPPPTLSEGRPPDLFLAQPHERTPRAFTFPVGVPCFSGEWTFQSELHRPHPPSADQHRRLPDIPTHPATF